MLNPTALFSSHGQHLEQLTSPVGPVHLLSLIPFSFSGSSSSTALKILELVSAGLSLYLPTSSSKV